MRYEKMSHWVITECEVEYTGYVIQDTEDWHVTKSVSKMQYSTLSGLSTPSSLVVEVTLKQPNGQIHSSRTEVAYQYAAIPDEAIFQLPTYGIPERTQKAESIPGQSNGNEPIAPLIPVWLWLSMLAVAFFVIGLLLMVKRAEPKIG